jgi:uncharacterized peroxidase-related enzyme
MRWPSIGGLLSNAGVSVKATEQEPIYLREVEANPQPSPYADLIAASKAAGRDPFQIWSLFAYKPEVTSPLASFTEEVMRAPAPISAGFRELIAAYTSYTNECQFCWRSHAAIAAELLGSEELVQQVLKDVESSPLAERERALLRFAGKITRNLPAMAEEDVQELRMLGWDDEAIYFTILVVSLFNFYNRWITASGVHPVSEEIHRLHGKRIAMSGYEPKNRLAGIQSSGFPDSAKTKNSAFFSG